MAEPNGLSKEAFKVFVCSKAYDIISKGRYRKILSRAKANNDKWAIDAAQSCAAVLRMSGQVLTGVEELSQRRDIHLAPGDGLLCRKQGGPESSSSSRVCVESVLVACKAALASHTPPCRIVQGSRHRCSVSGVITDCLVDIGYAPGTSISHHHAPPSFQSEAMPGPDLDRSGSAGFEGTPAAAADPKVGSSRSIDPLVEEHKMFLEKLNMFVLGDFSLPQAGSLAATPATPQQRGGYGSGCDDDFGVEDTEPPPALQERDKRRKKARTPATTPVRPARLKETGGRIMVHAKFSHFFLMLWYVNKIEHVVRNYTKCWLCDRSSSQDGGMDPGPSDSEEDEDEKDRPGAAPGLSNPDIHTLCESFSAQDAVFENMLAVFNHGHRHVMDTFQSMRGGSHTGPEAAAETRS